MCVAVSTVTANMLNFNKSNLSYLKVLICIFSGEVIDAGDEMDIDDAIGDRDEPEDRMDYDAGNDDMYYPSTATDSEMGPDVSDDNNLALPVEVQSPISTGAARFRDVDDDDLRAFIEVQKNRSTLHKTTSHVKLYHAFL